jgi:hypothetical protein
MRALRTAVSDQRTAGHISAENVQALMAKCVPAVSMLYFRSEEPAVPTAQAGSNYDKLQCFTCDKPSPVVEGRCSRCRDTMDSWHVEERT